MAKRYFNFAGLLAEKVLMYGIDDYDIHILSYLNTIQNSDNMIFLIDEEKIYYWITTDKIITDNPTLKLQKRALDERISKLSKLELIEKKVKCVNGEKLKRSYYRTTDKFREMLFSYSQNGELAEVEQKEEPQVAQPTIEKKQSEEDESLKADCKEILNHWNSKGIITHTKLTDDMIKEINKSIKKYTMDIVKQCIDRYSEVYHSDFFFDYKWKLVDFLKRERGLPDFFDEGSKWSSYQNYLEKKKKNSSATSDNTEWKPKGTILEGVGKNL